MNKGVFTFFLILFYQSFNAQISQFANGIGTRSSPLNSVKGYEVTIKLSGKTKFTDYKVISHNLDTTFIDTTLTIKKEYKYNFRRKDNFELLQFQNQGQTFNNLAYNYANFSLLPNMGFRAKHFNYINLKDVKYYEVPTPTTEIMYRTGQEQGQVLDALFTLNFSKRLNTSIMYRGLRSLGQYRRSLSYSGNFVTTVSYRTKKNKYQIRSHIAIQDFGNQENGGLTELMLHNFVNNNKNFIERSRLDVNLSTAENLLEGERFYLDHSLKLFSIKDTTKTKNFTNLKIGHVFLLEKKKYNFKQQRVNNNFFGKSNSINKIDENVKNSLLKNQIYLEFNSKYVLGKFRVKSNYISISHGYDSIINANSKINKIKLKGRGISFGGDWNGKIGGLNVKFDAMIIPGNGHLSSNYLSGVATYKHDSIFTIKSGLKLISRQPNYNFNFFQSSYDKYNWSNNFINQNIRNLEFNFFSKWISTKLDFTNIDNYTYFDSDNRPKQSSKPITYLKLKVKKEFRFKKIALDNTLMYQRVYTVRSVLKVPEFVTRNTLYYADEWFKGKPILVNIGIIFKYFTKYTANAYNPLIAEFTLQDKTKIGFSTFDVFFNVRVRRTRIFFKIDNVTSKISKRNYFSAPYYPYRDFSIRFGLVWNWFI